MVFLKSHIVKACQEKKWISASILSLSRLERIWSGCLVFGPNIGKQSQTQTVSFAPSVIGSAVMQRFDYCRDSVQCRDSDYCRDSVQCRDSDYCWDSVKCRDSYYYWDSVARKYWYSFWTRPAVSPLIIQYTVTKTEYNITVIIVNPIVLSQLGD